MDNANELITLLKDTRKSLQALVKEGYDEAIPAWKERVRTMMRRYNGSMPIGVIISEGEKYGIDTNAIPWLLSAALELAEDAAKNRHVDG